MSYYFVADLHYGHANICKAISKWSNKSTCRDFESIDDMNQAIINSINSRVGKDDVLFFLGDWSFGGVDNVKILRDKIECETIYCIAGNHDYNIVKKENLRGLFTEVYKGIQNIVIENQSIILCHFPLESWENSSKGSWHLHGHTHHELDNTEISNEYKRLDVGWEGKVYSFEEIKEYMEPRKNKIV